MWLPTYLATGETRIDRDERRICRIAVTVLALSAKVKAVPSRPRQAGKRTCVLQRPGHAASHQQPAGFERFGEYRRLYVNHQAAHTSSSSAFSGTLSMLMTHELLLDSSDVRLAHSKPIDTTRHCTWAQIPVQAFSLFHSSKASLGFSSRRNNMVRLSSAPLRILSSLSPMSTPSFGASPSENQPIAGESSGLEASIRKSHFFCLFNVSLLFYRVPRYWVGLGECEAFHF